MKRILLMILCSVMADSTFAQNQANSQISSDDNKTQEQEIRQKARKRLYTGGRDEQDLQVQQQLVQPTRKVKPMTGAEPIIETTTDE